MNFNKTAFIKKYGDHTFKCIIDFLETEAPYIELDDLKIINLGNVRGFEYEGNVYVFRKKSSSSIEIIDEVSEEHGASRSQTRFLLDIDDFLGILKEAKDILAEYK